MIVCKSRDGSSSSGTRMAYYSVSVTSLPEKGSEEEMKKNAEDEGGDCSKMEVGWKFHIWRCSNLSSSPVPVLLQQFSPPPSPLTSPFPSIFPSNLPPPPLCSQMEGIFIPAATSHVHVKPFPLMQNRYM